MPMILAMVCVCSSSGVFAFSGFVRDLWVSSAGRRWSVRSRRRRPRGPVAARGHEAGTRAGPVRRSRLPACPCRARSRSRRARADQAHALALEQAAELAVDGGDALEPGVPGDRVGPRLDGAVEVVGHGEHLADEILAGEPEVALALLRRSALEVEELGSLALERRQVVLRLAFGLGELTREVLDIGQQLGGPDIDLLGALLGARATAAVGGVARVGRMPALGGMARVLPLVRHRDGPPVRP
jgi:hypothetical protein